MNLENLVAISGIKGLFNVIGNRPNGLIVESIEDKTRRFVSMRRHQFTPLEGIGIYIDTNETVPISKIFNSMTEQLEDNPLPDTKADSEALREYFLDILPNHDQKRVRISDIKKMVSWYDVLSKTGHLEEKKDEE